jgi:hypothetical protein
VSDQAAFQEVDDAVRQDDLKAWWKRWGTPVVVACVVLIAVTVGWMQWRKYDEGQRALAGAAFTTALGKIGDTAASRSEARAELDKQAQSAPEPYRSLAALAAAQLLDKPEEQIAALVALAPKLSPELSDLALVIAGYRSVDTPQFQTAVGRLETMTGPERAFRGSVRELQALAAQRKGDLKRAREIWQEIARDTSAPQGAVQRAQALLALTGPAEAKPEGK